MNDKEAFLIVRVSGLREHRASCMDAPLAELFPHDAPTCVHYEEGAAERAEKELLRLTAAHPEEEFMLFKSYASAEMRAWMGDGVRVAVMVDPRRLPLL